jgi:CubicO group peptidase (beta-lactamase class C family)
MLPAPPVRSAPVDAPAPVPAATDDLAARVNALAQPAIDDGRVAGMVIGVVDKKGATRLFGFGRISRADPRPPDGKTVFEIGSVSKVFTSALLADLVERKVVALDDPIKKSLPPAGKVPSHGGREITLAHLATHSSGLPRMPANFAPKDPKNPYADYAADQLYAFLSSCTLERDPGALYEYSNLGAGLLGHILTLVSKQSYDALLAARITGPLGMKSTRVVMSAGQRAGLAEGHDEAGQVAPPWDQKVFEGAGGVHSTADDMLLFLRANLHQIKSPLDGAFTLTHQPRHDTEGTPGAVGLGWHVRDVGPTIWHNGQTGGYHSYVAFDPQQQLGVVLMSSSSIGTIDGIGYRLLRWLAGEPAPPPKLTAEEQMALYEEHLKENDWGHQPC